MHADPQGFEGSGDFRLIVTGGPIGWTLAAEAKAIVTEDLWSMYGSTEVGAACMTKIEAEPDTYRYTLIDPLRIKVLSDDGEDLPAGLPGNIWVQVHNGSIFTSAIQLLANRSLRMVGSKPATSAPSH